MDDLGERVKKMVRLKAGQRVNVWHIERGIPLEATLLEAGENEWAVTLEGRVAVRPGDELKLEYARPGDALYVFEACLLEVGAGQVCTLEMLGVPCRLQRRESRRLPVILTTQYIMKKNKRELLQGLIRDISRDGVLLCVESGLDPGSDLFLIFEVPSGRGSLLTTGISGKVVREHQNEEDCNYGVAFHKPFALMAG